MRFDTYEKIKKILSLGATFPSCVKDKWGNIYYTSATNETIKIDYRFHYYIDNYGTTLLL